MPGHKLQCLRRHTNINLKKKANAGGQWTIEQRAGMEERMPYSFQFMSNNNFESKLWNVRVYAHPPASLPTHNIPTCSLLHISWNISGSGWAMVSHTKFKKKYVQHLQFTIPKNIRRFFFIFFCVWFFVRITTLNTPHPSVHHANWTHRSRRLSMHTICVHTTITT